MKTIKPLLFILLATLTTASFAMKINVFLWDTLSHKQATLVVEMPDGTKHTRTKSASDVKASINLSNVNGNFTIKVLDENNKWTLYSQGLNLETHNPKIAKADLTVMRRPEQPNAAINHVLLYQYYNEKGRLIDQSARIMDYKEGPLMKAPKTLSTNS